MRKIHGYHATLVLLALITVGIAVVVVGGAVNAQTTSECSCQDTGLCQLANNPPPWGSLCADTGYGLCNCTATGEGPWAITAGSTIECRKIADGGCCPDGDSCWDTTCTGNNCVTLQYNYKDCSYRTEDEPCGHCTFWC